MKGSLVKDIFREIRRTKSRFFSIFAIIALGAGFISGLKATMPDMLNTMDSYYAEQNLSDLQLVSSYGFSAEDMESISSVEGLKEVYPAYFKDAFVENDRNVELIARIMSIPDESSSETYADNVNMPVLLEGRMPESPDECLVEHHAQLHITEDIGDTVTVYTTDPDDPLSDTLERNSWKVVGIVMSPQYISYDRGSTTIGDGSLSTYIMVPASNFKYEVYTEVYITLKDTAGISAFSDEYSGAVDSAVESFENLAEVRETERFSEVKKEANEKITDGKQQIADAEKELADAKQELADAAKEIKDSEKELADGWAEYNDGLAEYNDGKEKYDKEIAEAEKKLADARAELTESRGELFKGEQEYQDGMNQLEAAAGGMTKAQLIQNRAQLEQGIADLKPVVQAGYAPQEQLDALEQQLAGVNQLIAAMNQLESAKDTIDDGNKQLSEGYKEVKDAEETLASEKAKGEKELADAKKELADAYAELIDGEQKLADGKLEYEDGKAEYEEKSADAEKEIAEAKQDIADAEDQLNKLKKPVWYVFTREDNPGYGTYKSDSERIDNVAKVFPLFFFLVAMLVCLTTMTRMVEEHRTEIGTLKALGYGKGAIAAKYVVYSALASVLGATVGIAVGSWVFPKVIYSAYEMMYKGPSLELSPMPLLWSVVLAVCVLCTTAAAIMACFAELRSCPAELMRPKAPKAGKRVFLEKIGFIWKRLSFIRKVTIRNLFRYKKRIFMTILGIAGCTALTLTGFGLYSSISVIIDKQYSEIFHYNLIVSMDTDADSADVESSRQMLYEDDYTKDNLELYMKSADCKGIGDITLVVSPDAEKLGEMITFKDRLSGEAYELSDDGIIVTERFSELSGLEAGDEITFTCAGEVFSTKITAVSENYTLHFFYMTENLYKELSGAEPKWNTVFTEMTDSGDEAQNEIAQKLVGRDGVLALTFVSNTKASFRDTVENLNYVVLLIIVSAAALAFVVLYNLTNINITERIREIATIKVLGFYDNEVSAYVFRENILLTLMGDAAGLGLGIWLHKFVINVAQTDAVMFGRGLPLWCFAAAFAMTVLFAVFVNFIMYFHLKKVSMVESLKSVE